MGLTFVGFNFLFGIAALWTPSDHSTVVISMSYVDVNICHLVVLTFNVCTSNIAIHSQQRSVKPSTVLHDTNGTDKTVLCVVDGKFYISVCLW